MSKARSCPAPAQYNSVLPLLTSPSQDPAHFSQLDEARVQLHVESMFLFSLVWSVGCSCATNEHRRMFDAFIRAAVACQLEEYVSPSGEKWVYWEVGSELRELGKDGVGVRDPWSDGGPVGGVRQPLEGEGRVQGWVGVWRRWGRGEGVVEGGVKVGGVRQPFGETSSLLTVPPLHRDDAPLFSHKRKNSARRHKSRKEVVRRKTCPRTLPPGTLSEALQPSPL